MFKSVFSIDKRAKIPSPSNRHRFLASSVRKAPGVLLHAHSGLDGEEMPLLLVWFPTAVQNEQ